MMTTKTADKTGSAGSPGAVTAAKPATLKDWLESAKDRLATVASSYVTPDQLIRLALLAASRQPQLLQCAPESILAALMNAAQLGIRPGGINGRGYLVPRKNNKTGKLECHFDPGWRGLLDIARRSGQIVSISAHVVRDGDRFEVFYGTDERIIHLPNLASETEGDIVAAYACAKLKDGSVQIEVLTRADLGKVKKCSAAQTGPWLNWFDEMARKSAVRRLVKYLPVERDEAIDRALQLSADAQGLGTVPQRELRPLAGALEALDDKSAGRETIDTTAATAEPEPATAAVAAEDDVWTQERLEREAK